VNAEVKRLLGVEGKFGEQFGLLLVSWTPG
jgi:hypothetical protein